MIFEYMEHMFPEFHAHTAWKPVRAFVIYLRRDNE